jgi:hypothetical protein
MNNLKKILAAIAVVFTGSVSVAVGQSYVGCAGVVNAGYVWTPALSSSFRPFTQDSLQYKNGFTLVGADFSYRNGKARVVFSGYLGFQEAEQLPRKIVEPFFWKSHAAFGWTIYTNKSFSLYPQIGAGATGTSLNWYGDSMSDLQTASAVAPSIDLSFHIEYLLLDIAEEESVHNASVFSINAGYTRGLATMKWNGRSEEQNHKITPHQLQGWYVTISVGGFAYIKNR